MTGNTNISVPNAGALKVARALGKYGAVRALVHLDSQADSRDLERPQVPAGIVEIWQQF